MERGYRCTTVDLPTDLVDWFDEWTDVKGPVRYAQHDTYDLVVHLAYVVGGRAGIDGNRSALAENVRLDSELFRWAVTTKQPHVLYFSSSAAYPIELQSGYADPDLGIPANYRLHEDDCNQYSGLPDADYGWAKLTGERLAANARAQGVTVSVVRPFSGYGSTQSRDYPFTAILERAENGDNTVWGPPGQTRDWIHIDDVVKGALAVADLDAAVLGWCGPVNLCTGVPTEMGALSLKIQEIAGVRGPRIVNYLEDKPTGVMYRVGDPTKMLRYYYTPQISLEEGIHRALIAEGR
jgi:nucleoside-diphosphate-sugar epimerase